MECSLIETHSDQVTLLFTVQVKILLSRFALVYFTLFYLVLFIM